MTDKEFLEINAHISDEEVLRDIAETETEIRVMEAEAEHLSKTPLSMSSARWDHMRADARRSGVTHRKEFIAKLQNLLETRRKTFLTPLGEN